MSKLHGHEELSSDALGGVVGGWGWGWGSSDVTSDDVRRTFVDVVQQADRARGPTVDVCAANPNLPQCDVEPVDPPNGGGGYGDYGG